MAANPPTPMGVMAASVPPQIITSAAERWMSLKESPTAWALEEQAVQVAEFGPLAPWRMEMWPAARLTMEAGMKKGEIRRGPPSSSAVCSRSMTSNPPMPEPICTPTRSALSGVIWSPDCVRDCWEAARAN